MIPHRNKPPARLPDDAKALWPSLVDELAARGTLQRVAVHRLGIYCQLFAQYFRCTGFINEEGQVLAIRSDKGELKKQEIAPEAVQQLKLVEALRRFDKEFGFTEETGQGQDSQEKTGSQENPGDVFDQLTRSIQARMAEGANTHN